MISLLDISTSGLTAQRARLDTIAGNIANYATTRDSEGNISPFRRRFVVFEPRGADGSQGSGVRAIRIETDKSPPKLIHDPGHPDANDQGYVALPNIDLAMEYVNAIEASRAYEANVSVMDATKSMMSAAMRILA
jgi:flagellar basal-body rod protein FlgC